MKKGFEVKGSVIRTISAVVIIGIGLSLAGCGEEMARMQDEQLKLQAMIENNALQIAALGSRIEQNQNELQAGIVEVQDDIRKVAANTAAVGEEQMRLQETVHKNDRQMTNKIALIEQTQEELRAGIVEVQNDTKNVAVDIAADITTITDEQAGLYEKVENNSRQLTNNVALIEQNQQQWQGKIEGLQQNIQEVTTRTSALGDDLLKLQEVLQNNIRELVGMMDVGDQEQLKFQEKIQKDLLAYDNSISAIKQSQSKLQNQIEDVRISAEAMNNELPIALEQLKEELIRESSETEQNEPPSSSTASETNSGE